jgi:DSF synthase
MTVLSAKLARDGSVAAGLFAVIGETPHLSLAYEADLKTLWATMNPLPVPCFTADLIGSVLRVGAGLSSLQGGAADDVDRPVKFVVFKSARRGVFNLGGDLAFFLQSIEAGDFDAVLNYGRSCVLGCHGMANGFCAGVVTVALVQGMALGGGFESACACDFLVGEKSSVYQLPELQFGTFPGAGAANIMRSRLGSKTMLKLVVEGRRLGHDEASSLGIVDYGADDGDGERLLRELIGGRFLHRHAAISSFCRNLRDGEAITIDGLYAEAERWARTAMQVSQADIETMKRIVAVQKKKFARP